MTEQEARALTEQARGESGPTGEDQARWADALAALADLGDGGAAETLGQFHARQGRFDLALKYGEMAAARGSRKALTLLGDLWYCGRLGGRNFGKAFHYYSLAQGMGDLYAACRVADMYCHGYGVQRDEARYRAMIGDLYRKVRDARRPEEPLPEVYLRLGRIRAGEGKQREALDLYDRARAFLARRIQADPFPGNLSLMKQLVREIDSLRPLDPQHFDLFDLYRVMERPGKVRFVCRGASHEVEGELEDAQISVRFDRKWYLTLDDFFLRARLEGRPVAALWDEMAGFVLL